MVRASGSKFMLFCHFVLSALVLEAFSFLVLDLGFMPEYFFYNLSIIVFIGILIFAIPNYTAQFTLSSLVLLVQAILVYTNYILYTIYGDMFSLDMLMLIHEAADAATSGFVYWDILLWLIAVFAVILTCGIILLHFVKKNKISTKQHFSFLCIMLILFAQSFSITNYYVYRHRIRMYQQDIDTINYVNSDAFLMDTSFLKRSSYAKFGSYGYFVNLLVNELSGKLSTDADEIKEQITVDYFNSGTMYSGNTIPGSTTSSFGIDQGNNVICIMMESLEWFAFGDGNYDPTLENLSAELTPNVYSLIYGDDSTIDDNSILAENFFGKAKTNISEGIGIMGSYPNGLDMLSLVGESYDTTSNALGFTLPNILKSKGYTTSYVHSNVSTFYNRNLTHVNMGFDNVVGKETIKDEQGNYIYTGEDLEWNNWAPEGELVNNAMEYIVPDNYEEKPFYTFYLNVSTHGSWLPQYNQKDGDALKYMNFVKYGADDCVLDENDRYVLNKPVEQASYTEWYQNVLNNYQSDAELVGMLTYYQCGVCGLDEAIGNIVYQLKTRKYSDGTSLFDKTTILLYSDHFAYYNNMSYSVKGIGTEEYYTTELHRIPMVLSSPGIKNLNTTLSEEYKLTYNTRFCSAYDIVPTLLDLLGISFNENFYIGHSLFRPADNVYQIEGETKDMAVYYSNTGGLYSLDVQTDDMENFVKQNDKVTDELITLFKTEASKVLTKQNYLYMLDLYGVYNQITTK